MPRKKSPTPRLRSRRKSPKRKSPKRKSPKRKSPRRRSRRKSSRMPGDNLAIIGLPSREDIEEIRHIDGRAVNPIQLGRIQNMNLQSAQSANYSAEQLLRLQGITRESETKKQREQRYFRAKVKQIKGIATGDELFFIDQFEKQNLVEQIEPGVYEVDDYRIFSIGVEEIEIEKIGDDRKMSSMLGAHLDPTADISHVLSRYNMRLDLARWVHWFIHESNEVVFAMEIKPLDYGAAKATEGIFPFGEEEYEGKFVIVFRIGQAFHPLFQEDDFDPDSVTDINRLNKFNLPIYMGFMYITDTDLRRGWIYWWGKKTYRSMSAEDKRAIREFALGQFRKKFTNWTTS
jgi:hypothetical protein